ncbi:hypothetical protein V6N11_050122 [Hibiscus sabdariffa]|uniref:RNase H type-1 domain-containing protein n=1 Tax=Hibiscus sabdariffa TaxID=183260 RepID=A0ABR2T900_9ROSI
MGYHGTYYSSRPSGRFGNVGICFQQLSADTLSVAQKGFIWARYFKECPSFIPPRQVQHTKRIGWSCPRSGWICINVDGDVYFNTSMGSIGGLTRDSNGHWIIGFCRFTGVASAFNTVLWTINTRLQLAWDNGFQKVQIQSDCLEVVTTVQENVACSSSNSLV